MFKGNRAYLPVVIIAFKKVLKCRKCFLVTKKSNLNQSEHFFANWIIETRGFQLEL